MKQIIRRGLKEIIVDEVPDPVVISHHVLVRPLYSLISSGTETASIHQEGVLRAVADDPSQLCKIWKVVKVSGPVRTFKEVRAKLKEYAVLGYSGAGIVTEKHPSVKSLELGDRVAYGGEGRGHGESVLVGENLAVKVPTHVPFEHACFATLGSIAINGVRIANISLGEKVAVVGLGLVGQLIAQLARLQGGYVIAADLKADRVELAHRLGSDAALLSGSQFPEQVLALTDGQGVDCVIVAAASKSAAPCQLAVDICRDRGRIVDVGAVELSFPWHKMYRKELQLLMARAYGPGSYDPLYEKQGQDYPLPYVRWTENRNMQEFLRLVEAGRVQVQPLITHEFAIEEAPKAYDVIMDSASQSLAVLVRYPAAVSNTPLADFKPVRRVEVCATKASSSKIGVALVGAGNLARWVHLPNLKQISSASLRAIHSSSGPRGKSYAIRFGAKYCASDYEEILRDPDIDLVVIVSRNPQHASQAIAALRSGKHVFVEKPMALTEEECRNIYRATQETGKQITVGFNRRYAPCYVELKKLLRQRTGPSVISCRINSPGISGSYWMADPASGGAILGEACHFVDLMYWLLEAEPVAVSAFSLPSGKQEPIGENNMAASFHFADGSVGNLTYCTVGSRTSGGERVEVYASGMAAEAQDFKRSVTRTGVVRKRSSLFAEKGYAGQMESFFSALQNDKLADIGVRDGARATIGCLRMLDSARTLQTWPIDIDAVLDGSSQ
jgi:predicted dehydrogenase/threonine dehydrogenase-like Zn-dependent dehydrogenase